MTKEENLNKIRAACFKANSAKFDTFDQPEIHIGLADVLLAIQFAKPDYDRAALYFGSYSLQSKDGNAYFEYGPQWNLRLPLDEQSDETLAFIAGLL